MYNDDLQIYTKTNKYIFNWCSQPYNQQSSLTLCFTHLRSFKNLPNTHFSASKGAPNQAETCGGYNN